MSLDSSGPLFWIAQIFHKSRKFVCVHRPSNKLCQILIRKFWLFAYNQKHIQNLVTRLLLQSTFNDHEVGGNPNMSSWFDQLGSYRRSWCMCLSMQQADHVFKSSPTVNHRLKPTSVSGKSETCWRLANHRVVFEHGYYGLHFSHFSNRQTTFCVSWTVGCLRRLFTLFEKLSRLIALVFMPYGHLFGFCVHSKKTCQNHAPIGSRAASRRLQSTYTCDKWLDSGRASNCQSTVKKR